MQLDKIRKVCLANGAANLMHADCGDFINSGGAFYFCDGLAFTPDMLAAIFGLTEKQKALVVMQEFTPEDVGLRDGEEDSDVASLSDAEDKPLTLEETLETSQGTVRIYRAPGERSTRLYLPDAAIRAAEKKDGVEICLRRTAAGECLAVACEGYLVRALFRADAGSGPLARAVRRRVLKLAAVTADVRLEDEDARG